MATKMYLTASTAGLPPALPALSVWNTGSTSFSAMITTKSGSNTTAAVSESVSTNPYDVCLRRFVSMKIRRKKIVSVGSSESITALVIGVLEDNTAADMCSRVRLGVLRGHDGTTVTNMINYTEVLSGNEWPTTVTARTINLGTVTETLVRPNDRLVLEVGYRATNSSTTQRTGTIRYGGTDGTDLANGTTSVTSRSPHITFPASFDDLWTAPTGVMSPASGFF